MAGFFARYTKEGPGVDKNAPQKKAFIDAPAKKDILEYFEVRECLVTDKVTKKRSKGYEILRIKE